MPCTTNPLPMHRNSYSGVTFSHHLANWLGYGFHPNFIVNTDIVRNWGHVHFVIQQMAGVLVSIFLLDYPIQD